MIFKYQAIKKGASHEADGKPCQDYLDVRVHGNILVAAVADGLGSEMHSDMASEKAASKAVEYCVQKLQSSLADTEVLEIVRRSFYEALYSIQDEAEKLNYPLDECNTTLSLAVFEDGNLYFGHAGDSGIIALRADGRCIKATEQQGVWEVRDGEKVWCVFPLSYKDNWIFGKAEGLFAGVLLATDGLLETFFPQILSEEQEPLYIAHIMRFIDKNRLEIVEKGEEEVQKEAQNFINSIPPDRVKCDDIALVVLLNTDINVTTQPQEYYNVPDFDLLRKKREEKRINNNTGGACDLSFRGLQGSEYSIDSKPFSSGSASSIYRISNNRDLVTKVYSPEFAAEECYEKLVLMIENNPKSESLAWPIDILINKNDSFTGYVMPMIEADKTLDEIYAFKEIPEFNLQQKIALGVNICVVLEEVHKSGYVVGDFNSGNIGVNSKNGHPVFFDVDSFNVDNERINGKVYRTYKYLKELFSTPKYSCISVWSDYFALAVHIFRLLFNGFHPYSGISNTGGGSSKEIATGDTTLKNDQYCFRDGYEPASLLVPPLNSVPKEIGVLFKRAFIDGESNPQKRPDPSEWTKALLSYKEKLRNCNDNNSHYYYSNLPNCVWCEADYRHKNKEPWPPNWPESSKKSGELITWN